MLPLATRERRALLGLATAAARSRAARIRLDSKEEPDSPVTVDVLGLSLEGARWTVAAWFRDERLLRILDLASIRWAHATPRAAGDGPPGFDRDHFRLGRYLDPDAGPPVPTTALLDDEWGPVARALFPTSRLEPLPRRQWACRLLATRPALVHAMVESLAMAGAVDSVADMAPPRERELPARLLALTDFLANQPEPVTRSAIYEQFPDDYRGTPEAVEKKFTRDKEALRDLGFLLQVVELGSREEQFGYRIDAHASVLPSLDFTPEEAAAIWTAGLDALQASDHPYLAELESALRKLRVGAAGIPPRTASGGVELPGESAALSREFQKLIGAWERRKRVTIEYLRVAEGTVSTRDVDVYGWASRRGEWIFVGHCHLRGEVRIFYASRLQSVKVNTRKLPKRPSKESDYDIPANFDIRRWSRQQIWDYDVHPPKAATLHFRGSLAAVVKQLLPGAKVETATSGARVVRLEVRNLRGLVRQALAWGPEAELIDPPEGRELAREILATFAEGRMP